MGGGATIAGKVVMCRNLLVAVVGFLLSCSGSGEPLAVSVLYSNRSASPGTAVITWLTPATATKVQMYVFPCEKSAVSCGYAWYSPGFRTDTVYPNAESCVHFVAPAQAIAVEMWIMWAGGLTEGVPAGHPTVAWASDSAWGFDGQVVQPAGTTDSTDGNPGTVIRGC